MSATNTKLNIEQDTLYLDFAKSAGLPFKISATLEHDFEVPVSYCPPNNVAKPLVEFSLLTSKTVDTGNGELTEDKPLFTTSKIDATPFLDITKHGDATWNTSWRMIGGSLFFHALFWMDGIAHEQRRDVLYKLGDLATHFERQFPNNFTTQRFIPDLETLMNLYHTSPNTWYHVYETQTPTESVWLKRRLVRFGKEYIFESRWTFVSSDHTSGIEIENKTTYAISTPLDKKPAEFSDILQFHESRKGKGV